MKVIDLVARNRLLNRLSATPDFSQFVDASGAAKPKQARHGVARVLRANRSAVAAMVVLIVALLLVGVVSKTPIRHALQVAPGALLLAVGARRSWFPCAAAAVFAFWLFCMSLIWLFLLGIAKFVSGRFTPVEIALTLVIGLASIAGLVAACRARPLPGWPTRIALFVAAAAIQFAATWLSVQPSFANR